MGDIAEGARQPRVAVEFAERKGWRTHFETSWSGSRSAPAVQDAAGREVTPPVVTHVAPALRRIALRNGDEQWAAAMPGQVEAMFGPRGKQAVLQGALAAAEPRRLGLI
ncbi:hypothetical protein AB0M48_37110 [Lentzea sp. NPDC051208]|uniref:hypothetical protein n=1 Tax=Lentzea sp. NPDC051208 TaxID=3154642 RepID=UPI003422E168